MADWIPLTATTDYTLSGNLITLVGVTPTAGSTYDVHYSYADASAEGGHSHAVEQRDGAWGEGHWSLAHTPDGGEFLLLGSAPPIPVYVVYDGDDSPSTHNARVRRMGVDRTDGSFVLWETDPIAGFVEDSGTTETVDAFAYHPTDRSICYIGTHGSGGIRIYKCDGETLTVVHTLASAGFVGQIAMHATDGRVAWCLAGFGGAPTLNNVYASDENGENFTGQGEGYGGAWVGVGGINSVVWAGGTLVTCHTRCDSIPSNPATNTIVVTVGPSWSTGGLIGSCRDQFSNNIGSVGSIGYAADINGVCWSYWHFAQFLGTPNYTGGGIGGGAALTLSTTTVTTGVWPDGSGLAFVPDGSGIWLTGAFGGSSWTQQGINLDAVLRRGFNLLTSDPARRWAVHAPYLADHLDISTDGGVTWQEIPDVPFCRMAAFQGGSN